MKTLFYPKLAITNIKNNSKTYVPYILTCIATVVMFYNMAALAFHPTTGDGTLGMVMALGTVVVGIFATIFLFYTYSFLVKRRKKEFGLFNILGMEKRHIGKVMWWESVIIGGSSIGVGLLLGILLSKLMTLILYKMLHFVPGYAFNVSVIALVGTLVLFILIFFMTFLNALWQVYRAKPIELLNSAYTGEKELKSNWGLTILGVLTLGGGYYIALSIKDPLSVIGLFFVAVLLVMMGTYCLFTAGSIVLLKMLRKNKGYYYQTKHFISLSSMIYRMKKNAVGLANICIMSTAVLVMISTTVSMYVGMEDLLDYRFPQDAVITAYYTPETRPDLAGLESSITGILEKDEIGTTDLTSYEFLNFTTVRTGNQYEASEANLAVGTNELSVVCLMNQADYTKITGQVLDLQSDEVAVYSEREMDTISLLDETFSVKIQLEEVPLLGEFRSWLVDVIYVVVESEDVVDQLYQKQEAVYGTMSSSMQYDIAFDFIGEDQVIAKYCAEQFIDEVVDQKQGDYGLRVDIRQMNIAEFYMLYGGLFFLGIFLGTLFLLAMVLIIYYKQVMEGFEDKERFSIMKNVGMSEAEVKDAIGSQVMTVFALPMGVALIHLLVAFPILTKLLAILNLTNVPLFRICTIVTAIVLVVIYAVVYTMTSKVYYKIVNG